MAQLVTRLDDALMADVDALIAAGVVATRSEAVRAALVDLVDRHRRLEIGRQIADGYRRIPQDDTGWDDEATIEMIAEEPW